MREVGGERLMMSVVFFAVQKGLAEHLEAAIDQETYLYHSLVVFFFFFSCLVVFKTFL